MNTTPHPVEHTPVLIVGGGIAGLSAALFLAWRGVPCVLVEKHPGSSPHPRAIGFTPRSIEQLRTVGLEARIPQVPFGHGRPRRVTVESLAGAWAEEVAWSGGTPSGGQGDGRPGGQTRPPLSPCAGAAIAQDTFEPMLRDEAIALGADVRLSTLLVSLDAGEGGILARLRPRDGDEYSLRADYLIAADGHASPIRERLGIGRAGHGHLQVVRSVLFRASLDRYLEAGISQFELDQPGLRGMLTTYRDGRWLLMFNDDEERDEATLRARVLQAVGIPDLPFEIITTGRWELSALIADRFSVGRVFLAGDAAHTLPPARGGYGANTGIEDAFNLAWKLEAVLSGASSPALLDTYDAERRPIAWLRHDQIFARRDYARWATDAERAVPTLDDDAMELGQLYRSAAVLGAGGALPPALRPDEWAGQPGTRAPHVEISVGGAPASTLDLFHRGWALITGDPRWCEAAAAVAESLGIGLRALLICGGEGGAGSPVTPPPGADATVFSASVRAAFGLGATGASLIRPDGYVAWRAIEIPADPVGALAAALVQVAALPR